MAYYDIFILSLIGMICYGLDVGLRRYVSQMRDDDNGRWFILHAIANFVVCICTYPSIRICAEYGSECVLAMVDKGYDYGSLIVVGLHMYHIMRYHRILRAIDWIHHLLSGLICGGISYMGPWGHIRGWVLFFNMGFPGLVDYIHLVGVRFGVIDTKTEKWVNMGLNTWIRAPGLVIATGWSIPVLLSYQGNVYVWLSAWLVSLSVAWNGLYFMADTVRSYTVNTITNTKGA